jgi:hypothetical protein
VEGYFAKVFGSRCGEMADAQDLKLENRRFHKISFACFKLYFNTVVIDENPIFPFAAEARQTRLKLAQNLAQQTCAKNFSLHF